MRSLDSHSSLFAIGGLLKKHAASLFDKSNRMLFSYNASSLLSAVRAQPTNPVERVG